MNADFIRIKGASEHNLKNISLDIPRHRLVVITGLSGSGKSTLAFDTVYAEASRRYVESLSTYARQFLEQTQKPAVESIEGLSPAIAIRQRASGGNPRSTVGTVTEIYDYLRLLFARIGSQHCPRCGIEIKPRTPQQIVDDVLNLEEGAKIQILAPVVNGVKGSHERLMNRLRKEGFTRVRIDDQTRSLDENIVLAKDKKHTIRVVVDRLVVKKRIGTRLTDSIELALSLSDGKVVVEIDGKGAVPFSTKAVCERCGISTPGLTPQMFSFNNPNGACRKCHGLGWRRYFDPALIVPDESLSIRQGAVVPWSGKDPLYLQQVLGSVCRPFGSDILTPFQDLPEDVRDTIFYGSGERTFDFRLEKGGRKYDYRRSFEGLIPYMERRYRDTGSDRIRSELERFMRKNVCSACRGTRLRRAQRAVRVGGMTISEMTSLPLEEASLFFRKMDVTKENEEIAGTILQEVKRRLGALVSLELGYLSLDRATSTLSGGEEQRIRLGTQISSGLAGVLYVLDEPSIGLHPRDNAKLLENLMHLRDRGNTVLVVEHDAETIFSSDHVIDMGPGAGENGGGVVFEGPVTELLGDSESLTGLYCAGKRGIPLPFKRRKGRDAVRIEGASENNLRGISVSIPVGVFTCVTGVSGSGKSSLVNGILFPELRRRLYGSKGVVGKVKAIRGIHHFDKVINVDQSPIGKTSRSNPATYTGVFAHIRELFSMLPESKARGYKPGRFSFNVKGGRCEACKGEGVKKIGMYFLPDVFVPCEVCGTLRYNRDTLEIKYKGFHVGDILGMTVQRAFSFFENIPGIRDGLKALLDVGLGYVRLGQSAETLSGGEAQRMKLSRELGRRTTGRTLYLLDEPTTGLHFADIEKLLEVLNYLVGLGNTVLVIEHNLDVIKAADYIIDLGPEGGEGGGRVVAQGTPEEIAGFEASHTGRCLKEKLGGCRAREA